MFKVAEILKSILAGEKVFFQKNKKDETSHRTLYLIPINLVATSYQSHGCGTLCQRLVNRQPKTENGQRTTDNLKQR
jgi:hypothetical protein